MKNIEEYTDHSNFKLDDLKPSRKEQLVVWLISPIVVLSSWGLLLWICSQ